MRQDGPQANFRINVIGTSGAGKTTLAARLGERLGVPHVDLDAIYWAPNWTGRPEADFRADLTEFIAEEAWVVSGNYTKVAQPMLVPRVTMYVWVDYSRWRVTWQVLRRTVVRCWTGEELWAGNRESWRLSFFSRDSILWWSFKNFRKNRRRYSERFKRLQHEGRITPIRLRSPRAAEQWLAGLGEKDHGH